MKQAAKRSVTSTRPRKDKATRRREILSAVIAIVGEAGMTGLTTREVALRVGIAQPTVMLHFGSKDEMLVAMIDAIHGQLADGLKAALIEAARPDKQLAAIIRFHFDFLERFPALPKVLFSDQLRAGASPVRERLIQMVGFYTGTIAAIIADGQDDGVFAANHDASLQARLVISMFQGLAFRKLIEPGQAPDGLIDLVTDQVLFGLKGAN